jgi:SAM-dependent methyltransferase
MTQPTSVDMTFDTSLVDLKNSNSSFRTIDSDPSADLGAIAAVTSGTPAFQQTLISEHHGQGSSKQSQACAPETAMPLPKASSPIQHIPTQAAYEQWASVYDSDGNMLQALDDFELATLLPSFLSSISKATEISILDLGCGTGRNTTKLISHPWPLDQRIDVVGLDFSQGMLGVASAKLSSKQPNVSLRLQCCDCFPTANDPTASPTPVVIYPGAMDAVISTLVLEHIPLSAFFSTLSSVLRSSGMALVTNMHADMGAVSQAGFVNAEGVKIRGSSYSYTVQETLDAARQSGLEVLSVRERSMTEEDVESGVTGKRGLKWVGAKVWYALVVRKVG